MNKFYLFTVIGLMIMSSSLWGQINLTAPFSDTAPTIDGVIGSTEWQEASSYNLPFLRYETGDIVLVQLHFVNDGMFLYIAAEVPFPSHTNAYFEAHIDGDHSHTINGVITEPHIDIGYTKAGTDSPLHSFNNSYKASPGMFVDPPIGSESAYSGTSQVQYEFKIVLSDLGPITDGVVGLLLDFSINYESSGTYFYPTLDNTNCAAWADLYIAPASQQGKNILVYATSETTSGYYASSFDEELPAILAEDGFTVTVTDRMETPQITAALLNGYDQLWLMSTDPYSGSGCFSEDEINAIIGFRNAGNGLLIMADDGPPGHSFVGDANQISTQLGVIFGGQYNYGTYGQPFAPDFSEHPLFTDVQTIVCTGEAAVLSVSGSAEVVATYGGNNMIAILDDGQGRVVFDASFVRFWDADERVGYIPHITVGNTPQYAKNIANWLGGGGQLPQETGYISVLVMGYEAPCNPTVNLAGANVRIYNQNLSYNETFIANDLGEVDLTEIGELPLGTYMIEVSHSGYVTTINTTDIYYQGQQRSVSAGLYPITPSLFAMIPNHGETVNDTKTAITLSFNKPMDLNSLNDPNLLTILVDGIQIFPNQDYYIVQDMICPETYHLYEDENSNTEIDFGLAPVDVVVQLYPSLKDASGSILGTHYLISFHTKGEYLFIEDRIGIPDEGHYLTWDHYLSPDVTEETRYRVGLKGDLNPQQGDEVTFTLEISAVGDWENTVPVNTPLWPDIRQGEPRYFTGLNGIIKVAVRDDAASLRPEGVRQKFVVLDDDNEEHVIEMHEPFTAPTCLDYFTAADPDYQTMFTHSLLFWVPFGSVVWDAAQVANQLGLAPDPFACNLHDIHLEGKPPLQEPDNNRYDYYDLTPLFMEIATAEGKRGYKIRKMTIEFPLTFDKSSLVFVAAAFKPFVLPINQSLPIGPGESQVKNHYEPGIPGLPHWVSNNGQFEMTYVDEVNVGSKPQLPSINSNQFAAQNLVEDRWYYGLQQERISSDCEYVDRVVHPIGIRVLRPNVELENYVCHYRLELTHESQFSFDKHAGYLILTYDDKTVSLGSASGGGYGTYDDITIYVSYGDGSDEIIRGSMPAIAQDYIATLRGSTIEAILENAIGKAFDKVAGKLVSALLGFLEIAQAEATKQGYNYAAPLMIPSSTSYDDNISDQLRIDLFIDGESWGGIREIAVDIPLIFHELPESFLLEYHGRPWKAPSECVRYHLKGRPSEHCDEYQCYEPFAIDVGAGGPPMTMRGHSPVYLNVTDPLGYTINRSFNSIAGATYREYDVDLDGTPECEIEFEQVVEGEYVIAAVPYPNANPDDTYSITISWAGRQFVLADNVQIQDMPAGPYVFNISLQPEIYGTISEIGYSGVANVIVEVTDSAGSLITGVVSDTLGIFNFDELNPGLYTIRVVPPPRYEPTYNDVVTKLLVGSQKEINFYLSTPDTGTIYGHVYTSSGGLLGIPVDLYDTSGVIVATRVTNDSGWYEFGGIDNGTYSVSISTPLGYQATEETKEILVHGLLHEIDFELTELDITPQQRSRGYWAHQLHKALQKPKDYTLEDFSDFVSLIDVHFNQNQVNPVDFYSVPQPANQADSLAVLKKLLHMRNTGEHEPFLKRLAKSQLIALMLNVVSGRVSQTHEISSDGRTVSQLITYCDMLVGDEIDPPDNNGFPGHGSPWFRYIYASFMLVKANLGLTIPAGMIPEDVVQIAYRINNQVNLPSDFELCQNYPNPFNPITKVSFSLPYACEIRLEILNILGQKVATLAEGKYEAGSHEISWDASGVASGIYLYRLEAEDFVATKKMTLIK
jgi:hypothetical protein